MAQLLNVLVREWHDGLPLPPKFNKFTGDIGPVGASLPLRLAGGLHALVLSRRDPGLSAGYPPNAADDATIWAEVARAMLEHAVFLDQWTDSAPKPTRCGAAQL